MAPYAEEGCKLFVYGVNESTSNSELQEAFSKYGNVVDTYNTGKGFAFVTYENKQDASTATDQLNGQEILGQQIKVNVARPKNDGGGGGGGRGGGGRDFGGGRDNDRGGRDDYRSGGGGGRDRSPRRRSRSPAGRGGGGGGFGGGAKEGDWMCPGCNNSNFARRDECNRCKAARPGGGGGGGGGGGRDRGGRRGGDDRRGGYDRRGGGGRDDRRDDRRGGGRDGGRDDRRSGGGGFGGGRGGGGGNVRDGDWPCPSCNANNFASRSECFKCHAPK